MKAYHKIPNLFKRDMAGSKKLIPGLYASPELELLKDIMWVGTEKIDGTNVRVSWDGYRVELAGRTDRANLPPMLLDELNRLFMTPEAEEIFEQTFGAKSVILFGEGYGYKIQNGGLYRPDSVAFRLYDILNLNSDCFFPQVALPSIAKAFGVEIAPEIFRGTLEEAVEFVKTHRESTIEGTAPLEGIVVRPVVELKDRCGDRLIAKVKCRDF